MKRFLELARTVALTGTGLLLLGPVPVLAATFTVTNTNDSGYGSLRWAIEQANAHPNEPPTEADEIQFNVPGVGVRTITVLSDLPTVTDKVAIQGATQPGYIKTPLIRIDGANTQLVGLRFESAGSTLDGLNITRFFTGVALQGGGANTLTRCFIGTDATGRLASGNGTGIFISSSDNLIGGTEEALGNLISGNSGDGILVTNATGGEEPPMVAFNNILANRIGTRVSGLASLGNGGAGIHVEGALATGITSNVIAGNKEHGILIENGAMATSILANSIGTDVSGDVLLGNTGAGIYIQDSSDNVVGLAEEGQGNRIAYNSGAGVTVVGDTSLRNTIRGNSSNANLGSVRGIDLGDDGITPNDNRDVDMGPNTLQNTPSVTLASNSGGKTTIVVGMSSTPSKTFTIDLYVSPSCGSAGSEPEKTWFASKAMGTESRYGTGTLLLTTEVALDMGAGVTAVATDAAGNTSEYSLCKTVL